MIREYIRGPVPTVAEWKTLLDLPELEHVADIRLYLTRTKFNDGDIELFEVQDIEVVLKKKKNNPNCELLDILLDRLMQNDLKVAYCDCEYDLCYFIETHVVNDVDVCECIFSMRHFTIL